MKTERLGLNIALVNKHLFYRFKGDTECRFISWMFYVAEDKDRLKSGWGGNQRYGYKTLIYLLCAAPAELWARPARMDISYPLALWSPEKSALFAQERRAFQANKAEKWQALYNGELPENTFS